MQYRANDISTFVEDQFPAFYREDSAEFVEFVKEYYSYLDTTNERNFSKIRDIDTTLEGFLIYYKRKYLADLPFVNFQDNDIPFLVKHARDFYSRKGTQEALQLLFRMFYRQEVEIYQPASQILKLSDSKYTFNVFIEFIPVSKISEFPIRKGDTIEGDTSKASAFVDEVVFYNINGALTPVAYISNMYGSFITDDGLIVTRDGSKFYPGKLIYGSISNADVLTAGNKAGNEVGDRVSLQSTNFGVDGEAIVTRISETPSGVVNWELLDGGWGYDTNTAVDGQGNSLSENIIYKSTQVLVLDAIQDEIEGIQPFDTIEAINRPIEDKNVGNPVSVADRGAGLTYYGSGTVIAYEHPVLFIATEPQDNIIYQDGAFVAVRLGTGTEGDPVGSAIIEFPNAGKTSIVLNRASDGAQLTVPIDTQAEFNNSASFDIAGFDNQETVSLITDVVGDYVNVPLDSLNYGMSGQGNETLTTQLKDAFEVEEFTLGSISRIRITDAGEDYKNNVRTVIRMPTVYNFNYGLVGLVFDRSDFLIQQGDILSQTIQVQDLTYDLVTNPTGYVDYTVRGQFERREGNLYFFKPLTFYQYKVGGGINFRGRDLNVISKTERAEELSGGNAEVIGTAEFLVGQIKEISVLKSGFRYRTGETVNLINQDTDEQVARAKIIVDGTGSTEGYWATTTSHLNDNNRFIHDNDFYQEYSYQISSILDPSVYEDVVKNTTHVAGSKMFSSPLINTLNDVRPSADVAIEAYDLTPVPLTTEDGTLMFTEEGGLNLQALMYAVLQQSSGLGAAQTGGTEFPILSSIIMRDRGDGQAFANIGGGGQSVAGLTQPLPVGVYCTTGDAAELVSYINNPAGYSGSYRTEIENLIEAINNEKYFYDPPLEREDVVVTLTQPTRTVNYTVWNEIVSEQLAATIVNFGDNDVQFDQMESQLGVVGDFDFSLDSFDETRLTLDNAVLTFDRT